jgi:hypothetical protein
MFEVHILDQHLDFSQKPDHEGIVLLVFAGHFHALQSDKLNRHRSKRIDRLSCIVTVRAAGVTLSAVAHNHFRAPSKMLSRWKRRSAEWPV